MAVGSNNSLGTGGLTFSWQFGKPGPSEHSGIGERPRATRSATVRLCGSAALTWGAARTGSLTFTGAVSILDNTFVAVASGTMNFQGNVTGTAELDVNAAFGNASGGTLELWGSNGGYSGSLSRTEATWGGSNNSR